MSKSPVQNGSEVVRNLIKPLCGILRSARQGDMLRMQVEMQSISMILVALGFPREARKAEEACL
jgi:hypothetical protein